jgi:hypothetical protein
MCSYLDILKRFVDQDVSVGGKLLFSDEVAMSTESRANEFGAKYASNS